MSAATSERTPHTTQPTIAAPTKKRPLAQKNDIAGSEHPSKAGWRPAQSSSSGNSIQPEIAVLLHYIVDEPSDMTAKTCAVQMLIEARRSCLGEDVQETAYSATYFDLLSGAASACSAVVSTPESLGGNDAYATLWRSALCGLIPSIILRLERAREADQQRKPTSQPLGSMELMSSVVTRLFESASQTLEQCGVSFPTQPAGRDKVDEDSVMLDAMIQDDSDNDGTGQKAFLPVFVRSLIDKGLIAPLDQQSSLTWPDSVMVAASAATMRSASLDEAEDSSLTLEMMFAQKITSGEASDSIFLDRFRDDYVAQAPLSDVLLRHFKEWAAAAEVDPMSHVCAALLEHDVALNVWMMHASPISVMHALSVLLNNISQLPAGEDTSMLGSIILFAQVIVQLAVGAGATYDQILPRHTDRLFPSILRSSAATRLLAHLTKPDQDIVGAWITSLFGSDGISDDLIRSSPPHMLLRVTPTIFSQIVAAAVADIVDGETLRGGLTYFLQDLLSYTLPGAVRSLLHDVEHCHRTLLPQTLSGADRSAIERRKSVCISVLCGLLRAESCPTTVKRLVAVHVVSSLDRCKPLLSDEADVLCKDLNSIASAQQYVCRTDLWIKAATLVTADPLMPSSSDATAVTLPGAMDALLNLNASLYSIAAQRGASAVSRLLGNMLRADADTPSVALQRSVACSIGLIALREYLDDPCGQIDLSQATAVRITWDLAAAQTSRPCAAAAAVLQLVRQLTLTFTVSCMQQHMQHHHHQQQQQQQQQQQNVGDTTSYSIENACLSSVADALAAINGLVATSAL